MDGVRGVAALCVAIYHRQDLFSYRPFFNWGWTNVDLFFLISGLVISHVYEKRVDDRSISFPEFLSHRIARLWPMHLFAMLVMFGVDQVFLSMANAHMMDWKAPLYTFLLNLVLLQHAGLYTSAEMGRTWDGNGWSLTPEILANLAWFYLLTRRKLSSELLATIVLVFAVVQFNFGGAVDHLVLGSNLIRCTISYALGCLIYRHFLNNPELKPLSVPWALAVNLVPIALFTNIILKSGFGLLSDDEHWDWMLVLFAFPALTCCALVKGGILNRVFSSRALVFLGTISYSIYLLHVPIALLINVPLVPSWLAAAPYRGLAFLVALIVVSTLAFYYVETPARKYLRNRLAIYLEKLLAPRNQPSS